MVKNYIKLIKRKKLKQFFIQLLNKDIKQVHYLFARNEYLHIFQSI